MITENLSTLKIHKLTKAQYERELAAGNIDENALYLTPDEEIDLSLYATTEQLATKADVNHSHNDYMTKANPVGTGSFSMNRKSGTTVGDYSVALGKNTTASGYYSHAEGYGTVASKDYSHAEGYITTASGIYSHAEGSNTTVTSDSTVTVTITDKTEAGLYGHAEGYGTVAYGTAAHAEGNGTMASGSYSHAEGIETTASGDYSHAEGGGSTASGNDSHAEGHGTTASGSMSHAEGCSTTASGIASHAAGYGTTALNNQYVIGHYNGGSTAGSSSGTAGDAFIIGKGSSSVGSNAFRVGYNGKVYAAQTTITAGADYGEYFEWQDSNPNNEDRRGYFVTLDGENIKIAEPNDYILGIVSGMSCVIGNGDEDWRGRYILDDFGAFITEEFEYEEKMFDKEIGDTKIVIKTGTRYKENPDYDPTLPYIQREDRPEWDVVGMMGVLSVKDDGTCQVNGFCKVAEGGIATASENGYRVIKRVNENIVKVVFR